MRALLLLVALQQLLQTNGFVTISTKKISFVRTDKSSFSSASSSTTTTTTTKGENRFSKKKVSRFGPRRFVSATSNRLRTLLWPGTKPLDNNPNDEEVPLPPGSLGCPFRGSNIHQASSKHGGPGAYWRVKSARLRHPPLIKSYYKGKGVIMMSTTAILKQILGREFNEVTNNAVEFSALIAGRESLRFVDDRSEHSSLRRLLASSLGPEAVARAVPIFQDLAQNEIQSLFLDNQTTNNSTSVQENPVIMSKITRNFAINIAWKQILGLPLKPSEISTFQQTISSWLRGLFHTTDETKNARSYLISRMQQRVTELEQQGKSDGSTLGNLVFASDEESSRTLERQQIIDNALLLMLAGTDTSAGTLAAAIFLLGLHPPVWDRLVQEQEQIKSKYGHALTMDILNDQCLYLNAVLKETLRLLPVVGGSARGVRKTLIVNHENEKNIEQTTSTTRIPAGWGIMYLPWLTHHHDPKTYVEDGSHMDVRSGFQPDRWLDDETMPTEFIPFGAGPRYCAGAALAMAEMKTFLAVMARQMDFVLASNNTNSKEDIVWGDRSIVPLPADGVAIYPRKRI